MANHISTEAYKGTRDFYPEDMAVQQYIFKTWAQTAESFGYERYDASILEPSELYKSKGAENEEMVNEQTYTFIDRGDREVTLRPEMTPTAARMVAGKARDLSFPVRWYSIPNLFRYERPQRGRLREHWQLNCDIFGAKDWAADVEMISLAHQSLVAFGATPDMFEIRVNDRVLMHEWYTRTFAMSDDDIRAVTRVVDRKHKVTAPEFKAMVSEIVENPDGLILGLSSRNPADLNPDSPLVQIIAALGELGITNVVFDPSIARGFDYYTGTIFEVFDTSPENNRSMLGGGRYDNLTSLFGGEPIPGVGFGFGDVVMRDFLETHNLLPQNIHVTAPTLVIIPTDSAYSIESEKMAQQFRAAGVRTAVDFGERKLAKKIAAASDAGAQYVLVLGENELSAQQFTLKELATKAEHSGSIDELINTLR
jgi:histidyl-tRNA synthetase